MRSNRRLRRSKDHMHSKTVQIYKINKKIETIGKIPNDEIASNYFLLGKFNLVRLKKGAKSYLRDPLHNIVGTNLQIKLSLQQCEKDFICFSIEAF